MIMGDKFPIMQPLRRVLIESEMLSNGNVVCSGENIYVKCIYPFIFEFEKDFDKALQKCCDHANRKINNYINRV